jgi:hypothetical protein
MSSSMVVAFSNLHACDVTLSRVARPWHDNSHVLFAQTFQQSFLEMRVLASICSSLLSRSWCSQLTCWRVTPPKIMPSTRLSLQQIISENLCPPFSAMQRDGGARPIHQDPHEQRSPIKLPLQYGGGPCGGFAGDVYASRCGEAEFTRKLFRGEVYWNG